MYDYCQLFALGRSIRTQHWPLGLFYVMNDKLYVHIRYHHYMTDATESLFTKATYYTTKEERALGALNGTLLHAFLSASHKNIF